MPRGLRSPSASSRPRPRARRSRRARTRRRSPARWPTRSGGDAVGVELPRDRRRAREPGRDVGLPAGRVSEERLDLLDPQLGRHDAGRRRPATFAGVTQRHRQRRPRHRRSQDLVTLRLNLNVPASANCFSIDFRFLSEEFPTFVGDDGQRRLRRRTRHLGLPGRRQRRHRAAQLRLRRGRQRDQRQHRRDLGGERGRARCMAALPRCSAPPPRSPRGRTPSTSRSSTRVTRTTTRPRSSTGRCSTNTPPSVCKAGASSDVVPAGHHDHRRPRRRLDDGAQPLVLVRLLRAGLGLPVQPRRRRVSPTARAPPRTPTSRRARTPSPCAPSTRRGTRTRRRPRARSRSRAASSSPPRSPGKSVNLNVANGTIEFQVPGRQPLPHGQRRAPDRRRLHRGRHATARCG